MEHNTLDKVLNSQTHDDYIEYFVFPPDNYLSRQGDDSQTEDEKLQEILYNLNAAAQEISGDYLWHKDPFVLQLVKKGSENDENEDSSFQGSFFHGITRFGDNVEDEWLIVHLLTKLSIKFPELVVRVIDNDGEFLLIEAADYLPDWAESDESCAKRVYIYQGHIHLIPKDTSETGPSKGQITILGAVNAIRAKPDKTVASKSIQRAIFDRTNEYPGRITTSLQYANVLLPPKLAVILKQRPDLVAPAVHAFHYRDPSDLKSARMMSNFKPAECLVKTRVRFSKCLYAMLMKQDFRPDAKTGWEFPRPTSYDFKAHSLGAKLTTGFEILISRSSPNGSTFAPSNPRSMMGWKRYEESLKKTGYYRDYLEGSKPFQQLAERAKVFFNNNLSGELCDGEDYVIKDIVKLAKTVQYDIDVLQKEGSELPADDDDTWMTINPDNLESMLEAQFKAKNLNSNPEDIPAKLKEFMKQFSDFEGVETLNGSTNGKHEDGDILEPLDFRADDFVSSMDKLLLELGNPDKDWDDSDDSFGSEEEDNEQLDEIKKMHTFRKDSKIHQLMNAMDEELSSTEVGKSFLPSTSSDPSNSTSTSKSAQKFKLSTNATGPATTTDVEELDEFDDVESFKPVNIDMNALANILESFQSQDGPSGPSANLLRSVGFDMSHMYSKKKPK